MLQERSFDSTEIKRKDWSLIYNPEFEQYRDKYKNIISSIQRIVQGEKVDGIESEMITLTASGKLYFTVELDGEKFFIKKIPEGHKQGGVGEFKAAKIAKQRLIDNNIKNVEIIDYICAFENEKDRYVVSRYDHVLKNTLEDVLADLKAREEYEKFGKLDRWFEELKSLFKDYPDFKIQNMAYDEATNKMILFDLNDSMFSLVESSDDEL